MPIKDHIKKALIYLLRIFPINKKVILFNNFYGKGFDDNPRAIAEQLIKNSNLKLYWVISKENAPSLLPKGIIRLKKRTPKYFFIIATAKIWVANVRLPEYYTKRKKQFYIQTWHGGSVPYKMVEYDAIDKLPTTYRRMMAHDNTMIDLMLSGSQTFTNVICRRAFKYSGEILECGEPKQDALINADRKKIKTSLKKHLGITEDNILLYMPTFRVDYSKKPYDVDLDKVKIALERKTGKTWKVLCKMHPNVNQDNHLINCSDYVSIDAIDNTQNAIIASDLLITDYSSVMFDALFAKRPVILYIKDYKQYMKHERGFYLRLEDLPFPSFKSTKQIIDHINSSEVNDTKKYPSFIAENKVLADGKASRRVAEFIKKKCTE